MQVTELLSLAKQHLDNNEIESATNYLNKVIEIDFNHHEAYLLLSQIMMPGFSYSEMIKKFHDSINPATYLEIGVANGGSMSLANDFTNSIGIDPFPKIVYQLTSRIKLFPTTSDNFFQEFDLFTELGLNRLDLAFIDGLHIFEQVLRDFINVERYSNPDTVILIDDCLPICSLVAHRERQTTFWTGDVWKIIPILREFRPDLRVYTIPTNPSGLGLILNLDATSTVLIDNYDTIVEKYFPLDYSYLETSKQEILNIIENDWDVIEEIIFS